MTAWQTECLVFRGRSGGRTLIRMPRAWGDREWLREVMGAGTRPQWDGSRWTVARKHYRTVVIAVVKRFGEVTLIEDYNTSSTCTESCQQAQVIPPEECECRCQGVHHSEGRTGRVIGWSSGGGNVLLLDSGWTRKTYIVTRENLTTWQGVSP